ncbi:MAG: hypothetical protein HY909_29480 [Deltaproteobacteria bacterium]|nr:hypothetical protein [Deltaproteobacteria bacterium]
MRRGSLFLAAALVTASADANGRFPAASHVVVGPGRASDVIALRVTFGLLVSYDAGRSFRWLCEDAMYWPVVVGGNVDPAVELLSDGTTAVGFEAGINMVRRGGCRVDPLGGSMGRVVADLTTDPAGMTLLGIESNPGTLNHVLRASAGGGALEPLGPGVINVDFLSLEVAPSRPSRVYLTGRDARTRAPRVYRSDDGGSMVTRVEAPFPMAVDEVYVSGVDPTDPDTVYFRANEGAGSALYRSTDGGSRVTRVATTTGPMYGFALSDDGRRVWYGSLEDGLFRSDDRGEGFSRVNRLEVLCLRHHAGQLYACSNWLTGFALGRSGDGGGSFTSLLRFEDLGGPLDCRDGNMGHQYCVERWDVLQTMLATVPRDAGARDAAAPGDASARDAATTPDAPAALDSGAVDASPRVNPAAPPGPCQCRAPGATPRSTGFLPLLAWALALRRRVRRGSGG